jgi:anaerobic selenocysteine-containing dehydrogenase
MNQSDIEKGGFRAGDIVDLINNTGGIERIARRFIIVSYSIPERCLATYFPETNVLVPIESVAERSNTPVSKAVVVRIRKEA